MNIQSSLKKKTLQKGIYKSVQYRASLLIVSTVSAWKDLYLLHILLKKQVKAKRLESSGIIRDNDNLIQRQLSGGCHHIATPALPPTVRPNLRII